MLTDGDDEMEPKSVPAVLVVAATDAISRRTWALTNCRSWSKDDAPDCEPSNNVDWEEITGAPETLAVVDVTVTELAGEDEETAADDAIDNGRVERQRFGGIVGL